MRVDGNSDEGPAHQQVQYWWTKPHLLKGSRANMVSSRNRGASFKNRVELQNDFLALAHTNMFTPLTLIGPLTMANRQLNKEMLHKNLNSAIDIYINRVAEGEVLDMERSIREQGAEGKPWEDKSSSEWGSM